MYTFYITVHDIGLKNNKTDKLNKISSISMKFKCKPFMDPRITIPKDTVFLATRME
jgi:hypothetical protein